MLKQQQQHYAPGSPIFREDREFPTGKKAAPITTAATKTRAISSKCCTKGTGVGANFSVSNVNHTNTEPFSPATSNRPLGGGTRTSTLHEMTVTVTQSMPTTATTTTVNTPPSCYSSTRSAAMMTLALGQRSKSPASTSNNISQHPSAGPEKQQPPTSSLRQAAPLSNGAAAAATTMSGGSGSSGSDNDGFNTSSSSSATALRRLYFKSGRSAKSKTPVTTAGDCIALGAYHQSLNSVNTNGTSGAGAVVPKLIIMGSSSTSTQETNINTSTDSASTLVTSVTHTDTSETCDSLDLGDHSGQSEPLFSSLEEPLLTAIQIDSEHDGTELELTSCTLYSHGEMSFQDSTESQESSLSIVATENSSTPLLANTHRTAALHNSDPSPGEKRQPNTAPPPSAGVKHFTFDPPKSPRSARTTGELTSGNLFSFKDTLSGVASKQPPYSQQSRRNTIDVERRSPLASKRDSPSNGKSGKYRGYMAQRNSYYRDRDFADYGEEHLSNNGSGVDLSRTGNKKLRTRDANNSIKSRNRYSSGGTPMVALKTSPKRESKRSPSGATSKAINSAPPTMKESNFFGSAMANVLGKRPLASPQPLSPSSQHAAAMQRKYSSSSSSGGSDRGRLKDKDGTMFPFDREALDYERIQRECFAVCENSSSATASSDSDETEEARSVYERHHSPQHGSPNSADIFQQYKLLAQQEQQLSPSRKNSKKCLRPESVMHSTIREHQQYDDAFYPQAKCSTSPGEMNQFEQIASKFEQIPPKALSGSSAILTIANCNNNPAGVACSASNNNFGSSPISSPTPPPTDLRVDIHAVEQQLQQAVRNKSSFKTKKAVPTAGSASVVLHDALDDCQRQGGSTTTAQPPSGAINVTPNPMETAGVCGPPRATIVVQQPSLSLDNTVETLLIKNEGDFVSVEQAKDGSITLAPRKRNSTTQLQLTADGRCSSQQHQQLILQQQQQQKRDDNMRQLLDVTNTLTFEELRDFEMRYGSPHHSRSQSVKTPGSRASGRPNQLCLPQQRSRVASMPNTGVEEEYYRLRHFSITGKGVVNRGDSLKSRRSRSNNSVASSNSSTEHIPAAQIPAPQSARTSATCSLASSRESSTSNPGSGPYRVLMLGGSAVGKSSLVSQFMTSEYLHAYDTSIDDDSGEKAVSVLLSGEESELIFIDHPYTEMTPDDCLTSYDPHGYCVIYSAADRSSFTIAEHILQVLWTNQNIAQKAVILVANKADLARSRLVTSEEGKAMATAYDCKFIETSVGINHNVDELLVGLLSQIRLKLENPEKSRDLFRKRSIRKSKRRACSPLSGACLSSGTNPNTPLGPHNVITDVKTPPGSAQSSPRKYRGSRTSTSLKVKGLLGRVWARDSKSKSCENLHVL